MRGLRFPTFLRSRESKVKTHSGDYFTIDRVTQAILNRGAQPFRLDTDKFPLEVQLSIHLTKLSNTYTIKYEVNPVGEFFWLECCPPKFPISQAIAEILITESTLNQQR